MIPLFGSLPLPKSWGLPTPLGSFSNPGVGWQRFAKGAQSWVQAMADVALRNAPSSRLLLNSSVTAVWTDQTTGQVTVQWTDQDIEQDSDTFDKVVLTTDMWTNSKLLNNSQNQYFWDNLYEKYIGYGRDQQNNPLGDPVVWDLMYGVCYVHSDENILSPDLRNQQETNQFNAYYAGTGGGNYNLLDTFTTYIQKNVLGTPSDPDMNADGIYLTMYGYVPQPGQKVPDQSTWLTDPIIWTHGNWTPAAMGGAKSNLYLAQGKGNISYDGQMDTNIYFAGNNTTVDSEEGALISAMTIADYAFGVNYPLAKFSAESLFAFGMYTLYHNVMFPKQSTSHAVASLYQVLPEKDQMGVTPPPLKARPSMKLAAISGKGITATRRKKVARKRPKKPGKPAAMDTKRTTKGSTKGKPASATKKTSGKTSSRKQAGAKKTKKR